MALFSCVLHRTKASRVCVVDPKRERKASCRRTCRTPCVRRRGRKVVGGNRPKVETCAMASDAAPGAARAPWRRRWTVVTLCFLAFLLCNMDRVNLSVAILPMAQEFGWDSTTVGLVQSSFFWGYLLTQIAGGVWADRVGGKLVLGFGVVWWSLATCLTPMAAKMGLPALLLARAAMGVGEGVAMPSMNNLLSKWMPKKERSRSLSLVYSGMYTGSVLGLAFSPSMIKQFSWPSVFYVFGSFGAVWIYFWSRLASSNPAVDPYISAEERQYILKDADKPRDKITNVPWKTILLKKEVWAIIISHFCHNWGTFILLTWMPSYYNQVLGLDLMRSGIFSVLPWITMAVMVNVGGWIADTLVNKGVSVTIVRKTMQTIGFMGPALCLAQLSHITTVPGAVLCMMGAQGMDAFSQSGLYSNHQDIGPQYAGILLGLSNTAGVLAGVIGTAVTGMILSRGTWDAVWRVAILFYCIGTLVWNIFSTGERVFLEGE
uniref:Major facilitator superfamily (MFS) profile domain-containing protein n=1 Tax=Picocystis salinarum TaxID=88271 RepID=A0A7S3UAN0_9CHLO